MQLEANNLIYLHYVVALGWPANAGAEDDSGKALHPIYLQAFFVKPRAQQKSGELSFQSILS